MEAFCELFFDNLATLLGITGLMIGFFLNVYIYYNAIPISPEYATNRGAGVNDLSVVSDHSHEIRSMFN